MKAELPVRSSLRCKNCSSDQLVELNRISSEETLIVSSDARIIDNARAVRTLCRNCACIAVSFVPEDRLKQFYCAEYDLGDEVQDHMIVVDNRVAGKHARVQEALFSGVEGRLAGQGRCLEIACGRGALSRLFKSRYPGWQCHAIDPSAVALSDAAESGEVVFINDCFDVHHFAGMTFDLIIAHGFLNRSTVLQELIKIRQLAVRGTLLSLDLLLLENSVFAPHVWDHSYMYTRAAIESYLACAGFTTVATTDCVSSMHYLCECTHDPQPPADVQGGPDLVRQTQDVFQQHVQWWESVVARYAESVSEKPDGTYALYGAGLYNAVLLSMVSPSRFAFVIDDLKRGNDFFGLPIKKLDEAAGTRTPVLLCARPEYLPVMQANLRKNQIGYVSLISGT
ncbi:class I SAM-dependent methyltransferase [Thermodesulfobacteriota bacterium]